MTLASFSAIRSEHPLLHLRHSQIMSGSFNQNIFVTKFLPLLEIIFKLDWTVSPCSYSYAEYLFTDITYIRVI